MSTQRNATMFSWPQLQGRLVGEGYRLIRYLDGSETSGRFEGKAEGTDSRDVIVQLFSLSPRQSRERLELWRSLQLLNRPEILKIFASGTAEWTDLRFDYLVTEPPDESLEGVLRERALDGEEAQQLLESTTAALAVMHEQQCVHASIQPASVYAVGDAIKLSVATVQRPGASDILAEPSKYQAPEVTSFGFSPASDIWSLGVTMFQALTRELPGNNAMQRAAGFPAPFPEILKHSLDPIAAQRWTASQILERLKGPVPERILAPEVALPRQAEPVRETVIRASNAVAAPVNTGVPPASVDKGRPKRRTVSPYAIAAMVLFLAFLWLIFGHRRQPEHPTVLPNAAPAPAQPAATTPGPSAPAATPPQIAASSPSTNPASSTSAGVPTASAAGPVNWRVIAFTFNHENEAAHKADTINKTHPDLHAEVFSPQPGRYLVAVGGWMPMQEAKRLRQQARSEGLPSDTYAQNFHR